MAERHSSPNPGSSPTPAAATAAPEIDCGPTLIDRLRKRIASGDLPSSHSDGLGTASPELIPAAVLVPLVLRESGITVLLTQRTAHLNDHAGQVSFPGGRRDDTDDSLVFTALREAEEEVGLDAAIVDVLGSLPEYYTGTGFRVTPVVAKVTPPLNLKLDDFEVAEAFEVPLAYLMNRANWRQDTLERGGQLRRFWATDWNGFYIWGATAGMLVNLMNLLETC
jgi:8-oxo-dGTP pyrophosphatase MutT (NUDIX family)